MSQGKDWYPKEEAKVVLFAENYVEHIDDATTEAGLPANTFDASKTSAENYLGIRKKLIEAEKVAADLRTQLEGLGTTMEHDIRAVRNQLKNTIGIPPKVLEDLEFDAPSGNASQRVAAETPLLRVQETVDCVEVKYTKYGHDGIELFGCRTGETKFTSLGRFTQNKIKDTRPNLVPGRPETRQFYGVYFDKDQLVGKVGPTVSLPVNGPLPGPGQDVNG